MPATKRERDELTCTDPKLDVVVVCCGQPKLSMGWFHLTQLLEDPTVNVTAIVEPFFLGPGKDTPGAKVFDTLRASLKQSHPDLTFCASPADLPERSPTLTEAKPLLALIAGRTCDAAKLFVQMVEKGATHVYIEKPGAENATQLKTMRERAAAHGVEVVVGYNKNVATYVRDGLTRIRRCITAGEPLPCITLEHCNEFAPGPELHGFMRGPGGEGMLHNMCCHELAIAVSLFGVTSERVISVTVQKELSELVELGEGRSDFAKVVFSLELADDAAEPRKGGVAVTCLRFAADRCGGNFSRLKLAFEDDSEENFCLPDEAHKKWIAKAQLEDPEIRSYFLQQAPDYKALKGMFVKHILAGESGVPEGVVGLLDAEETLRLADMLVPALKQCWTTGKPWIASAARL